MESKQSENQQIDVNFESHPPIDDDLDGIAALLRQTFLQFVDCKQIARYLIHLKDVTQIIALAAAGNDDEDDEEDDESDSDIYGVTSIIELVTKCSKNENYVDSRQQLTNFISEKSKAFKKLISDDEGLKLGMVINERYINLPAQLSLPTLKNLTQHLDQLQYSYLIFVSKILVKARSTETKLPSKKSKSGQSTKDDEPLVYVNAEEEIICEHCEEFTDIDVSSSCDENATWSFGSDIKRIPHRRIMLVEFKKWPTIMKNLEKELL